MKPASKSNTDESESVTITTCAKSESGRNKTSTGHAKQREGEVAQRSHDLGADPTTNAGAVFIEGDIADPVESVFDRPMVAAEGENALGIGTFGCGAGNAVNRFGAEFLGDDFSGFALDR